MLRFASSKGTAAMNLKFLPWLTFGTLVGVFLGFAGGKGSPEAPMIVGGVGATLGLAGFCIVSMVHKALKLEDSTTDHDAIAGAFVGTICGGLVGAYSGFGRVMISIFNPDLPERDWGTFFGATGGIFLGALFGACAASAVVPLLRQERRHPNDSAGNDGNKTNGI